jgi:hypothetical protein
VVTAPQARLPEPSTPFGRALKRALVRLEDVLIEELHAVLEEERRAAWAQGLQEGRRERRRPATEGGGAPSNEELRAIYSRKRER